MQFTGWVSHNLRSPFIAGNCSGKAFSPCFVGPNDQYGAIFWKWHQLAYCSWCNGGGEQTFIHTLPLDHLVTISAPHLTKMKGKCCRFWRNKEEERTFWYSCQFGELTWYNSGQEQTFTCRHSLEQSSGIKLHHFHWRKCRFRWSLPSETTMMEGSFEGAAIRSIVFDAMVETNKPYLLLFTCSVSRNLTSPLDENQGTMLLFWEKEGWKAEKELIWWRRHH